MPFLFHDNLPDEEKGLPLSSSEESDYQHSSVAQPFIICNINKLISWDEVCFFADAKRVSFMFQNFSKLFFFFSKARLLKMRGHHVLFGKKLLKESGKHRGLWNKTLTWWA